MDSQSELNRQRLAAHRAKLSAQPAPAKPAKVKLGAGGISILVVIGIIVFWPVISIIFGLIAAVTGNITPVDYEAERAEGKRAKQFHEDRKNFEDAIRAERARR